MVPTGAGAVRAEDAFDTAAVATWLRENTSEPDTLRGVPTVEQFSGGASNLTYLLRWPDRELILRRPPAGTKAKGAHDMAREFGIQRDLAPVFPLVPTMVGYCADPSVIGTEFYVMERLEGLILRRDLPAGVGLDAETDRERLCHRDMSSGKWAGGARGMPGRERPMSVTSPAPSPGLRRIDPTTSRTR